MQRLQNTILEMIARGDGLRETVDYLCNAVERILPDTICSVLLLDAESRLSHLSGPSLPEFYSKAIDGVAIGAGIGSCGTAAYTGRPVAVSSIATHPFWQDYKDLALSAGFLACWSTPIILSDKVMGTFAFYYRTERNPTRREKQVVQACVHLCAIAIERDQRVIERQRLAQTDALTKLPNRKAFNDKVACLDAGSRSWGLLLADVDNLKLVNDRFGHLAGDDLIRSVAERLSGLGKNCQSFRLGGDEFAVLVECDGREELVEIAERLTVIMKAPTLCAGQLINPSVTVGGDMAAEGKPSHQVHQNADYALYHAKERRRGGFVEFVSGLGSAIARRYRSIQDLTESLQDGRIDAFYQPVVELSTGNLRGFEALCRMRTRSGEIVAAGYFHEATRDGQAAYDLTQRMLETVAADMRSWRDDGLYFGRIGINVSGMDLYRGGLCQRLEAVFGAHGVPLDRVAIEVTESVYLDQRDETVAREISRLRAAGVFVALDDFGTGFASLTHLLTVPIDLIKIDKCFVQRMASERAGGVIIKGLIDIADGLGIRVIAEGVETPEQVQLLTDLGCQRGQGFLFSRPLERVAARALMKQQADNAALLAAAS
ncbi:EAL domain-containing protein [Ciceribacter sp. L1K23]|uniref:putative bifunctional diguanylate cyclase/phosphodiesterase n=1 Tax=Ciceribacter sp. L1K23 TaxID=2820276 RepID=UPI001B833353|nr:EAL domain-containing protein [Ciceribacter sp. L1K23]MBR0556385.1 EAL domain-containing protein [Ciceribacter sp. L1K23]